MVKHHLRKIHIKMGKKKKKTLWWGVWNIKMHSMALGLTLKSGIWNLT